ISFMGKKDDCIIILEEMAENPLNFIKKMLPRNEFPKFNEFLLPKIECSQVVSYKMSGKGYRFTELDKNNFGQYFEENNIKVITVKENEIPEEVKKIDPRIINLINKFVKKDSENEGNEKIKENKMQEAPKKTINEKPKAEEKKVLVEEIKKNVAIEVAVKDLKNKAPKKEENKPNSNNLSWDSNPIVLEAKRKSEEALIKREQEKKIKEEIERKKQEEERKNQQIEEQQKLLKKKQNEEEKQQKLEEDIWFDYNIANLKTKKIQEKYKIDIKIIEEIIKRRKK
ncbi:MAG: hypothetical protein PHN56_06590, partial [Candidatus Nanoarchaeia archaeon]|nr:hypothetical protein [Candidatus Nanoarchaeia archaeon]